MERLETDILKCEEMLPSVSRTFALTIHILPRPLRNPITVAYLLCRMADVLEDASTVPPLRRIDGLESLARGLAVPDPDPNLLVRSLDEAASLPILDPCGASLLADRTRIFGAYAGLPEIQRAVVSRWIQAMALGMSTYVARELRAPPPGDPAPEGRGVSHVLETAEELRAYAYYVAGTVGHLLTDLFTLHLGSKADSAAERLRHLAVPFGLGLQFTNILQDLAEDRRRGWSYVPEELARRHGTSARRLDDPDQRQAGLRVVGDLVREAARYLDQAMEFTLLLPRSAPRIRLFCIWPTFFALRTLIRLWGEERVLAGGEKIRINRKEVRSIMSATAAACLWNHPLERLYAREQRRLARRIMLRPV